MLRPAAAVAALILAGAAPVAAQAPDAAPAPAPGPSPSPAPKPSPIAEGDQLISKAGAQAFFRNESKADGGILLRHLPSGMMCILNPGRPGTDLTMFPTAAPGDDVACSTQTVLASHTFYATRLPPGVDLDQAFKGAVAAIKARSPEAKPFKPPPESGKLMALFAEKLPPQKTAIFRIREGFTRVSVVVVNGWQIKARMTSPSEAGVTAMADMSWVAAFAEAAIAEKKAKEAAAAQ